MSSKFTAIPLTQDRLALQLISPYPVILGMELIECGAGRALTRMTANGRIARSTDDPRPDPLALVGLLDHCFSNALAGVVPLNAGLSTYDLKIGFGQKAPVAGDVMVESTTMMMSDSSATVQAVAKDASGETIATAMSLFRIGSFPGGAPPDMANIGKINPDDFAGPMRKTLGLSGSIEAPVMAAANPAVVGWESGDVLHGGAIGAVLMAACMGRAEQAGISQHQRLESLNIRYLRPGVGSRDLRSNSWIERQGKAASYLCAGCFHEEGRSVALAEATFVA